MPPDTWILPANDPRCRFAEELYRTAQAVFLRLSDATTAAQFQAAQASLATACAALEKNLHWTHYGLSVGRHVCVKDVYREACARLASLASVQPEPPPAPPPKPRTLEDVLKGLGGVTEDDMGE
jgi:hypothetical protein